MINPVCLKKHVCSAWKCEKNLYWEIRKLINACTVKTIHKLFRISEAVKEKCVFNCLYVDDPPKQNLSTEY